MQSLKTTGTAKSSSDETFHQGHHATCTDNATLETTLPCVATPPATQYQEHERIAAYWLLVSAFEHVNRPNADGEVLAILIRARMAALEEFPPRQAWNLAVDVAHHEAIADRRRYLMRLEAGAR